MQEVKFWIIPSIVFGVFLLFALGILFYTYSSLNVSLFMKSEPNTSVMSMQELQGAMDSQLR